jgi:hypothetical protein
MRANAAPATALTRISAMSHTSMGAAWRLEKALQDRRGRCGMAICRGNRRVRKLLLMMPEAPFFQPDDISRGRLPVARGESAGLIFERSDGLHF